MPLEFSRKRASRPARHRNSCPARPRLPWQNLPFAIPSYADQSSAATGLERGGIQPNHQTKPDESPRDFVVNLMVGLQPTY